jgi:hypothetical protein
VTKLESILASVQDTDAFKNAVECLSQDFHNYEGEEDCVFEDDILEDFCYDNSTESMEFTWGSGVSKVAIVCSSFDGNNYALKTAYVGAAYVDYDPDKEDNPEDDEDWKFSEYKHADECRVEYLVYRAAVAAGLGHFFAEMIKIDIGIYMQEKYDTSICRLEDEDMKLYISETLLTSELCECYRSDWILWERAAVEDLVKRVGLESLFSHLKKNCSSFMIFYTRYSIVELRRLQIFLDEYDINDLHSSNIGVFGSDIKFIDYCGFGSSTSEKVGVV